MITKQSIDHIFETARVEEVIGDFVRLKRSGSSLKGLSPFSNEKTPSFMVSPAKQIWKDFSSGKGGNVVSFLMEHEQFTYPEALRYLAKRYNIEIEETAQSDEQKKERNERESLFLVNEYALQFYQKQLWETEEGRNVGLSYFKQRGFSEETIKNFQLGYSPEAYDAFTKAALAGNYQLTYLEKTGLTKVNNGGNRDRFRGRVLFPILSHTGRVLGFGGRILKNNVKAPKYLNSPESEIYHKSKILYGIHQARQSLGKEDEAFLVEGYTDVISLHQAGIKNVVASSGTSLTEEQIALLKRYTQNITVLFDGDAAGIKASLRGIDMILKQGVQVSVVLFPEGEDPDSFAQSNSQAAIQEFLKEEKTDFLKFKARLLMRDAQNDPLKKAQASREMLKSIALIPQILERDAYVRETARLMEIEENLLFRELAQISNKIQQEEQREEQRQEEREKRLEVVEKSPDNGMENPIYAQEEALCWLLLNYGDELIFPPDPKADPQPENEQDLTTIAGYLITDLVSDNLQFSHPIFIKIFEEYKKRYNADEALPGQQEFLRKDDEELVKKVSHLITEDYQLHNWRSRNIFLPSKTAFVPAFARETLLRFKEKKIREIIAMEQKKLKNTEVPSRPLMEGIQRLTALKNKIDAELNRVV